MKNALPYVGMVVGKFAEVGLMVAGKKAIASGMSNFSYIFYSNALASLILLLACFLNRRSLDRPSFSVIGGLLMLGILGFLVQIVGYAGITYASATVATAILNLIPGFTFVLAIIFRLERVDYRGSIAQAKIIGTVVSIVGAIIVTVYKGPELIHSLQSITPQELLGRPSDWILGGVLMTMDSFLGALFLIAQALVLKKYSGVLLLMLAYCSVIAVLSFLTSLIVERDLNAFSLQSKTRLFAILYSGFFGAGFQITIGAWCVRMKGPLFVSMFHPLGIVIGAFMGVILLGDDFYLGGLLGSIVIAVGFYAVMWGKAKEEKVEDGNVEESSKAPLLQDDAEEQNVVLS